jgi:hypothetical protein
VIGPGESNLDVMAVALDLLSSFGGEADLVNFQEIVYWVENENGGNFPTKKELREAGFSGKQAAHFMNVFSPMLVVAEYLDDYNNGIVGPGHAD